MAFFGSVVSVDRNVLSVKNAKDEIVRLSIKDSFTFPVQVGDIIRNGQTVGSLPIVMISPADKVVQAYIAAEKIGGSQVDSIMAGLSSMSKLMGTSIASVMDDFARQCCERYLKDSTSKKVAGIIGLSHKQAAVLLTRWYTNRMVRQIILLGVEKFKYRELYATYEAHTQGSAFHFYKHLINYPSAYGLADEQVSRIKASYGDSEDPYCVAVCTRINRESKYGHTNISGKKLRAELKSKMNSIDDISKYLVKSDVVDDEEYWYSSLNYKVEVSVAAAIAQFINRKRQDVPPYVCMTPDIILSHDQKLAISTATQNPISIITGGPGTGKTMIVCEIVRWFNSRNQRCIVASFTGKAVSRIKESFKVQGHGHLQAMTIDRMIACSETIDPDMRFHLVIDEVSMITPELMYRFFRTFSPERIMSLTLVGDINQLPPVTCGSFFQSMIETKKIPMCLLRVNFRSGGALGIVQNAEALVSPIRNLKEPMAFKTSDSFISIEGYESTVVDILKEFHSLGFGSKEITIITPMNVNMKSLNIAFQKVYMSEQDPVEIDGRNWYVGDRVMMTSNQYSIGVMNGDLGEIVEFAPNGILVKFAESSVLIPSVKPPWSPGVSDDPESDNKQFWVRDLQHAFAVTVHKSQGSEYPLVIVFIPEGSRMMNNVPLLYTAITRSSKICWLVYDRAALFHGTSTPRLVRNDNMAKRVVALTPSAPTGSGYLTADDYPMESDEDDDYIADSDM